MIEGEEDANDSYPDDWISYDEYVEEHIMLEDSHLVTGPGPPKFDEAPPPPEFLLPPPPLPGHSNECSTFSSHFDSCDISKVRSFTTLICKRYVFFRDQFLSAYDSNISNSISMQANEV